MLTNPQLQMAEGHIDLGKPAPHEHAPEPRPEHPEPVRDLPVSHEPPPHQPDDGPLAGLVWDGDPGYSTGGLPFDHMRPGDDIDPGYSPGYNAHPPTPEPWFDRESGPREGHGPVDAPWGEPHTGGFGYTDDHGSFIPQPWVL